MSEKTRKAFEAWYEADAYPAEHSNWFRRESDGGYELDDVSYAWRVWLSSRRQALEEAAKLCEAEQLDDPTDSADDIAYGNAVRDCASAIRREAEGK